MFSFTLASCCSEEKPSPNTVLARLSAHWPNFCDVLVNVMLGVMVLLMITWRDKTDLVIHFFISSFLPERSRMERGTTRLAGTR